MTEQQKFTIKSQNNERFENLGKGPRPICESCKNCLALKKVRGLFEIDCKSNPNLGGVSQRYQRCPHYHKV